MKISFGFSQLKEHIQAANEAIGQAIIGLGSAPASLALIFTSPEFAHPLILKSANNLLQETPILGCSSQGILTNKGIFKYGFAILLISFDQQTFFNTASVDNINKNTSFAEGKKLANKLLYGFKNVRRDLSIIFSDKLAGEDTGLIDGLQEVLGKSFPLIGSNPASGLKNTKTFQYINTELLSESCCGILFGGKLNFGFGIKHGWFALGKMRCVTSSSGNSIKEIDGAPAVKLYEDYFAKSTPELARELRHISISYPLGIYLEGEKEYLLRNIVSIKEDGSLLTCAKVPQGCKIRMMISTEDSRLKATIASCEEAKRGLREQKIKFGLIFDSAARLSLLGRQNQTELGVIKEVLGKDTPLIGIYSDGEQAPLKSINYLGKTYFRSQCINILAIGGQ